MSVENTESNEFKLKKLELLRAKKKIQDELPHLYGFKHYFWSRKFSEAKNKLVFLSAPNQCGKDLLAETFIPTPLGFKKLKDIVVGDYVFGSDGKPCRVIDIPWNDYNDTYRVHFNDGTNVVCGPNHEWICKGPRERFEKDSPSFGVWQVKETQEIIARDGLNPRPTKRYSIPVSKPVERKSKYLFDPYMVGLMIGDGSLTSSCVITTADEEISDYLKKNYFAEKTSLYGYRVSNLNAVVRGLNLNCNSWEKAIPKEYLRGSIEQRLALLQGLMDTDGTADKIGRCVFYTTSPQLASDVTELVNSLGGITSNNTKIGRYKDKNGNVVTCRECHAIQVKLDMPLFRLSRKLNRVRFSTRYSHERVIVKIEKNGRRLTKCLTVDSHDSSFLCTKNYIVTHNSSQGIKKCIDFCTNDKWWGVVSKRPIPILGFYLYPDLKVARREVNTKWIKEFLPRGDMKDHPQYGWKLVDTKDRLALIFNTGVEIVFMGYSQGRANILSMAASSPDFIFIDEEMPPVLWPELSMRVEAVKGTIHFLATPVECYAMWRDVFNGKKDFEGALVMTVSMYDCVMFEDGTPGVYTKEDIRLRIAKLGTQAEIDKRVFGRYVQPEGLLFPSFERSKNVRPPIDVKNWFIYAGVDPGSGGHYGHPYAIVIIAVNQTFTQGRVLKVSKGNDDDKATASDVLEKYIDLTRGMAVARQFYDWASADFGTLATRAGIPFEKADKSRDTGISLINSLFKNEALTIDEVEGHEGLVSELESLRIIQTERLKRHAEDDAADAMRYAITKIPWNIVVSESALNETPVVEEKKIMSRESDSRISTGLIDEMSDEINFWNDLYGE